MLHFSIAAVNQSNAETLLAIAAKPLFPKILRLSPYDSRFWRNSARSLTRKSLKTDNLLEAQKKN
jgi:hypothetical protein